MDSNEVKNKIIQEIQEIPPLPDVVVKVMQLSRNPDTTAQDLTNIISKDQALTGNILKLCNSAHYGLPRVVSSLSQAVMYLGFHTVRNLVITCSVSNLFSSDRKIYGYEENGLWKNSIATAMVSEFLAKKVSREQADTAFTAGLLVDVGHLIIGLKIHDTAETILELINEQDMNDLDAEMQALGFTHAELGGLLVDQWNFPEELVNAIRYHRAPEESPSKSVLISIVHMAKTIALASKFGVECEKLEYPVLDFSLKAVNIDEERYEALKEEAIEYIEEKASEFVDIAE